MTGEGGDLDRSYAHCRQVVRSASSNLAWCFWLLPRDQRRGMDALYAFARQADDLVDNQTTAQSRRAKLEAFRADLAAALASRPKVVGIVMAETSTGAWQSIEEISKAVHDAGIRDPELRDQATRASKSTVCNLCEGLPSRSSSMRRSTLPSPMAASTRR